MSLVPEKSDSIPQETKTVLKDLCLRKHKFLLLSEGNWTAAIWSPFTKHKILTVRGHISKMREIAIGSKFAFFPAHINTGTGWAWIIEAFDLETGEKVQTYAIEDRPSGVMNFFVFKDKYLFFTSSLFTSSSRINRITLGEGDTKSKAIKGEEVVAANPAYVSEFGEVKDWIFSFQREKIVIWDPETLETLRSVHIGRMERGFVVPNTNLIGMNEYPFLVNAETFERVKLPTEVPDENCVYFFPDRKILKETGYRTAKKYTVLDSDWKELCELEQPYFYRPYDSDSFLVFAKGTGNFMIRKFDGTKVYEDCVSDRFLSKGVKISDAVEIPLSKEEQAQETQRLSDFLLSATPVAKDIAGVISRFI